MAKTTSWVTNCSVAVDAGIENLSRSCALFREFKDLWSKKKKKDLWSLWLGNMLSV